MLFNSYEFILAFLPVVLLTYYFIGSQGYYRIAIAWLVAASLFFYSWWNPAYVGLLIGSILFNYSIGQTISGGNPSHKTRLLLIIGIICNLLLLAYYKYASFIADTINTVSGFGIHFDTIILPLAISFFTFQQIAYLVDAYTGETKEYDFLRYCLFVTFFPQLIAGPIVHHKEMMPQFNNPGTYLLNHSRLAIGLSIFTLGLFKKIMLADNFAKYANRLFDNIESIDISFLEAWLGTLAYSFQIYFDFSGYSEMAIGLGLMFGISLPVNFFSPYRANSIIEFWRCWHITLSRFLRDYLYIPLGGNQKGPSRRYINLLITMLLGGLWHGAGWTFVIWGGLHGFYLILNHVWRYLSSANQVLSGIHIPLWFGRILTLLAVAFAWVYFRAHNLDEAIIISKALLGLNGIVLPESMASFMQPISGVLNDLGITFGHLYKFNAGVFFIVIPVIIFIIWKAPNVPELFANYETGLTDKKPEAGRLVWRPSRVWAFWLAILAIISMLNLTRVNEFIYFQF